MTKKCFKTLGILMACVVVVVIVSFFMAATQSADAATTSAATNNASSASAATTKATTTSETPGTDKNAPQNATAKVVINGIVKYAKTEQELYNLINNKRTTTIEVTLLKDYLYNSQITVASRQNLTINMEGHIFGRKDGDYGKNQRLFVFSSNSTLTLNGASTEEQKQTVHRGISVHSGLDADNRAKKDINGGLITGCKNQGDGGVFYIVDADNTTININNVTIAGNEDYERWFCYGYGGVVYSESKSFKLNIKNSNIFGNWAEESAGAIALYKGSSTVSIEKSNIEANIAKDNAGALLLDSGNHTLIANNSQFDNNYTDTNCSIEGRGGFCWINSDAQNSKLDFNNCSISSNKATEGGAFYVEGDGSKISGNACQGDCSQGSTIKGNYSKKEGGGIHTYKLGQFYQTGIEVVGFNILDNISDSEGGGLYLSSESCSVAKCNIHSNKSKGNGAAVYDNQDYNSLSNCTITGNKITGQGTGAAVYVCKMVDLTISGKMQAYQNYLSNRSENNIMLAGDSFGCALLNCESVASISRVGIDKQSPELNSWISSFSDAYDLRCFFSTNSTYGVVSYTSVFDGGDGRIKLEKGQSKKTMPKKYTAVDSCVENVSETLKYDQVNGYDVYKGFAKYGTASFCYEDNATPFYFSDGYFTEGGFEESYNTELATLSMSMAMSSISSFEGGVVDPQDKTMTSDYAKEGYANQPANIMQFFGDIGCNQGDIYVNDWLLSKPTDSSIGVAIASKEIALNKDRFAEPAEDADDSIVLVPVAIRSGGYESEWAGNVTIGKSGECEGFANAATRALADVQEYIRLHNLEDRLKAGQVRFWVSGFSRGGATANLLSKRLTDIYRSENYSADNIVCAYTFEAPSGGLESEVVPTQYNYQGVYKNIHNVINVSDLITMVAPNYKFGFIRYGVTHYSPGTNEVNEPVKGQDGNYADNEYWIGSVDMNSTKDYRALKDKMKKHLSCLDCVDDQIFYDDYFHTASLRFVSQYLGLTDHLVEYKGASAEKNYNVKYFYDEFFKALIDNGLINNADPRAAYTEPVVIGNKTYGSIQASLQELFRVLHSKDASTMQKMTGALSISMRKLDMGGIYSNILKGWNSLSDDSKNAQIENLINIFLTRTKDQSSVADFLSDAELASLKLNLPAAVNFLATFACWDYNTKSFDTGDGMIYIGTMLANINRLLPNHYQETVMAWLRANDVRYDGELAEQKTYKLNAKTPSVPSINVLKNNPEEEQDNPDNAANSEKSLEHDTAVSDQELRGNGRSCNGEKSANNEAAGTNDEPCKSSCDNSHESYCGPLAFGQEKCVRCNNHLVFSSSNNPGAMIFYTLDGSDPHDINNPSRKVYRGSISLEGKQGEERIYHIRAYSYAYGLESAEIDCTVSVA